MLALLSLAESSRGQSVEGVEGSSIGVVSRVIFHLLKDIRAQMSCVYKLCEHVAELDMLVSLTHVSSASNYVRPQFGAALDVRKARHPMLDFVSQLEPEPNDIVSTGGSEFQMSDIDGLFSPLYSCFGLLL